MFNIVLYQFNKKTNSLSRPTASGSTFQCVIKDVSSILTPVVELADTKGNDDIPFFNYAYIPAFKRYYFIDDMSWTMGTWTLSLHVDVLATYHMDIEDSTQYVLRSASQNNPKIIDTLYTDFVSGDTDEHQTGSMVGAVTRYNTKTGTWDTVNYFDRNIGQGEIVLGLVGGSAYGMTYYAMPVASFAEIVKNALALVPADMTDVSSGVASSIYDPMQYVTYCKWFPMKPLPQNVGSTMVHSIKFGDYDVAFDTVDSFCYQFSGLCTEIYRAEFGIPQHPQISTKPYMCFEPFSEYNLNFMPFGSIPLDSTKISGANRIRAEWGIDFCTGQAILDLYATPSTNPALFYSSMSEIGVTIPVSAMVMDWKAGLAVSALDWIKTAQSNSPFPKIQLWNKADTEIIDGKKMHAANKNIDVIGTMQNIVGSSLGNVVTKGSAGSFMAYNYRKPFINAWFKLQAASDNQHFGSPLCAKVPLSSLSGFTVCANASINFHNANPTAEEYNAVMGALNEGVYL